MHLAKFTPFIILVFYAHTVLGQELTSPEVTIENTWHYSHVMAGNKNLRIFLPPNYDENLQARYPVIYFFHGWAQRYFGSMGDGYSNYDSGDENNGDNIANYVRDHDVIVVKLDGFNQFESEELNLGPYNIMANSVSTYRQFPIYFEEVVSFIDKRYRTVADRTHRAVSGLSMGGFMTFFVAAKYPHLVSAAGNFCGSPEFFVGPKMMPVQYRHLDMYKNFGGVNLRLNYGTRDKLRYHHTDLDRVWPAILDNYKSAIYDASHITCGLGDMFDFILETFRNPPPQPEIWHHADVYPEFSVWGYDVSTNRTLPGFTVLEQVNRRGFSYSVRTYMPNGAFIPSVKSTITTAPVFEPNYQYVINDHNLHMVTDTQYHITSDRLGRLTFALDGWPHQIGINKMADKPNVVITDVKVQNGGWAITRSDISIAISLLNKGLSDAENIQVEVSPIRDHVEVIKNQTSLTSLSVNETATTRDEIVFHVHADSVEMTRLLVKITDGDQNLWSEYIEIPIRQDVGYAEGFVIADGRKIKVAQAAVESAELILGSGNGDGIANPGESIIILAKDQGKLYRTDLSYSDPFINPNNQRERQSDSWQEYDHIGGSVKFSVPLISSDCPDGHLVEFLAEYWLPKNIDHEIVFKRVQIKVVGEDKTAPQIGRLEITGDRVVSLAIREGGHVEDVKIRFYPDEETATIKHVNWDKPEGPFQLSLSDNGFHGDRSKDDYLFSSEIIDLPSYYYRVEVECKDSYGNKTKEKLAKVVFVPK